MITFLRFLALFAAAFITTTLCYLFFEYRVNNRPPEPVIPTVAIANYGPHQSLETTIEQIKKQLRKMKYFEERNINYIITHANFDTSLIMQMLTNIKSQKPDIVIALTTPVAQAAKNLFIDTPVVFSNVTDPELAGLTDQPNITGATDQQDLTLMLQLAKQLVPKVEKIGLFYSTGELNDLALLESLKKAAAEYDVQVVAVGIEHARDINSRFNLLKDVDLIYTGSSGVVQSAMAAIASHANQLEIPIFSFNDSAVRVGEAVGSYGIAYANIGKNTALIVEQILRGAKPSEIPIMVPTAEDHEMYLNSIKIKRSKLNKLTNRDLPNAHFLP